MKYLLLIYNDDHLVDALPAGRADAMMRDCFNHADDLRGQGALLESQQLEAPSTAKTVRIRNGRTSVVDGPFAETKEMLGGYNLIEAGALAWPNGFDLSAQSLYRRLEAAGELHHSAAAA